MAIIVFEILLSILFLATCTYLIGMYADDILTWLESRVGIFLACLAWIGGWVSVLAVFVGVIFGLEYVRQS